MRAQGLELANQRGMPVINMGAGSLVTYGEPLAVRLRRSANLVNEILMGAKAAGVPAE
jgi:hypothetical protein